MDCKVYYRGELAGKLHRVDVQGADDLQSVFESVAEEVANAGEMLIKPLLALFQGGKK